MCASEDWSLLRWQQVTDSECFQLEKHFAMAMVSSIQSYLKLTIREPLVVKEELVFVGFATAVMMFTNRIRSFFKVIIIETDFDYYC